MNLRDDALLLAGFVSCDLHLPSLIKDAVNRIVASVDPIVASSLLPVSRQSVDIGDAAIRSTLATRDAIDPEITKQLTDIITSDRNLDADQTTGETLNVILDSSVSAHNRKFSDPVAETKDSLSKALADKIEAPLKKTRKPWSEEARAAASQRMKDRRAAGQIRGPMPEKKEAQVANFPLINEIDEYIGQRADQNLDDSDWPDIKKMRASGKTPWSIAVKYDVEEDTMVTFIARQLDREKQSPSPLAR